MNQAALFTSGTDGYFRYRIPALVVSTQGTVLAFCEARRHSGHDDDEIDIVLRRSFDGGQTWEARQLVVIDGDRTCGNPCPVVDRNSGTIVLPFCKDNQEVYVTRSGDDGATWSAPQEITASVKDPAWNYLGTGPGHGIQLQSGRLLIPSWSDTSPGVATWRQPPAIWGQIQTSFALYSDDGGHTWQSGAEMLQDTSDECVAAECLDGTVYMNMRSRHDKKCRASARSQDGGHTWSPIEHDPTLPEPSCQAGLVRFDDERLLLSHPSDPEQRAQLTIRLSSDEGHTWPIAKILYQGSAAYSDLAATADHILCLYEADDHSTLTLARFTPEWLTTPE
jgi:sialidase-1